MVRLDPKDNTSNHARPDHHGTVVPDGFLSLEEAGEDIAGFNNLYPLPAFTSTLDAIPPVSTTPVAATSEASAMGVSPSEAIQATQTTAQISESPGLVIIANYDSSITNLGTASAQYISVTNAISAAVEFYETHITNPMTITIDFGYGEVNGNPLPGNLLAESVWNETGVSYSDLRNALLSHGDPASDLPSTSPVEGASWLVTDAEAEALGLLAGNSGQPEGYVGLSSTQPLTFDPNNRAVAGHYDAIGTLEHEISEVMGRFESLGAYAGTNEYTPLDLFRYSSSGVRDLTPGAGYFSIDGGVTNLDTFNDPTTAGGDAGDWSPAVTDDSYDQIATIGVANTVSATDLTVMNELGFDIAPACYVEGTRILGVNGEVRVEDLVVGDMVNTRFAGTVPVKWIGHRRIDSSRHPDPRLISPVRILPGAFGPNQPCRELFLSPDHAVAIGDALIPIRLLVNGASIRQETGAPHVHYFHVELDRHDILLANNLPAESYLDTGNRGMFVNAGAPLVLHPLPQAQSLRETMSCLPFRHEPEQVGPIWHVLARRAEALGFAMPAVATTNDPAICIVAGARRFAPITSDGDRHIFALPVLPDRPRLCSRSAVPSDMRPWLDDRRRLGVMVRRITLRRETSYADVALDDPRLTRGWWAVERDGTAMGRWTDGDADLAIIDEPAIVEVVLGGTQPYPLTMSTRQNSHVARAA